jgi:hypothetical protein
MIRVSTPTLYGRRDAPGRAGLEGPLFVHGAGFPGRHQASATPAAKTRKPERLLPLPRPMRRSARRVVLIPERGRAAVSAAAQAPGAVAGQ